MRIELCKGDTMTAKEYEKVLKDREKAWTNEEFKPHKLTEEGYITGGETWNAMDCGYPRVALSRPELTLKGLEYMEENSLMKKAADLAKGIVGTAANMI